MERQKSDRQRLNSIYWGMKGRCYNSNHIAYKHYGGRGISVCEEWGQSFDAFYNWAIANGYSNDLTLDRYPNNDGNYEPLNCRWATMKQQAETKRPRKNSNPYGEGGLKKLATDLNMKYPTLQSRFRRGWDRGIAIDNHKNFKLNNLFTSKPIIQYDMNGNVIAEYPSIKEVTRQTEFKKPMLIHHLKGKRKTAYGFIWKYKT